MEFIEQIENLKIKVVNSPRIYIEWTNTEDGRDKTESYERVELGDNILYYVNRYNNNIQVFNGDDMYYVLEEMYNKLKEDEKI